jgi:quercetin dioxygenase-like cupin family protein
MMSPPTCHHAATGGPVRPRHRQLLLTLVALVALTLTIALPATAHPGHDRAAPAAGTSFAVYHGPVDASLVTAGSDGHQLGDLRTASVPVTDANGEAIGQLDATLTTTSLDLPAAGDEHRLGVLVFSFGDDRDHQLTVHGVAHYPAQGATIETGDTQVRPVVGGSGRFAGATGEAVTSHLDDDTWVHAFYLGRARADHGRAHRERAARWAERAGARAERWAERVGDRAERRADRTDARAERRSEREAEKAQRKADQAQRKAERAQRKGDQAVGDAEGSPTEGLATPAIDALYGNVTDDSSGVVRSDLGLYDPPAAPGQQLGLWHYRIPAGQELAPHTHPGVQMARVVSGELEYTVASGEGVLLRADGTSGPMGPGTYQLGPGDGVVEDPSVVHFAANRGDVPVTLISATLYDAGEPLSTLVALPTE